MMPAAVSKPAERNRSISICKGIAIILMVIGHAEAPELITNFIYTFHMPLFFITAGYFFTQRHADNPWQFCSRRMKGLYLPFLKWSLIFLLLHNVWFHFGILNETYGNWTGGVTHPYSLKQFLSRLYSIFFTMSGYDEFIAGAFWFFRGLLVASILFLILYRLASRKGKLPPQQTAAIICAGTLAFIAFHIISGVKIAGYPNGFWRESWGIFFFGIGVIYRWAEPKLKINWLLALLFFGLLCVAATLHLSGMNNSGMLRDLWSLPLTATLGFLLTKFIAEQIEGRKGALRDLLIFIGENTLYIFIFHILAFKAVSLLKIWWYGLDPAQIGCHMVIHFNHTDFFWVLYSIAGTAIPLLSLQGVRYVGRRLAKSPEEERIATD